MDPLEKAWEPVGKREKGIMGRGARLGPGLAPTVEVPTVGSLGYAAGKWGCPETAK